ncbi:polysaccharide pyruvyl transferase family protein [Bifidobacterium moukalabense]|nr:polysaccharide pyruvyl transferase family protein [Bifidobacterium moukalabense]
MRNIFILTLNDNNNYGNRLQNYAMKFILEKYGSVFTVRTDAYCLSVLNFVKHLLKNVFSYVGVNLLRFFSLKKQRQWIFAKFTQDYVPDDLVFASPLTGLKAEFPLTNADLLVLGSDQIWNPTGNTIGTLKFRLGMFNPNMRRISYAASLGQSYIPDAYVAVFKNGLAEIEHISVREYAGKDSLQKLTDKTVSVVLDPTLMVSADKWLEFTRDFVPDNDRYVLTYFLGRPSDEQEYDIQKYAKAHGCRVRRMLDLRDEETYVAGPQDFVELFSKAQYVFTDSYHACCFSILFHKQFTVFNRAGMNGKSNMNSRMETLFRLFDLDSVMMDSGLAPEIDYEKVDHLLEENRRKSQNWLDKAMEG